LCEEFRHELKTAGSRFGCIDDSPVKKKNDGKRIKRQKGYLPRAIGLYLWDQQKEEGNLNLDIISNFFNKLESMIEDIIDDFDILAEPEEFLSESGRKRVIDSGREFSRLVRHTDKCIQRMDVLPIT
jgi:hypothetical protein